jgi:hypothetical protein
LSAICMKVPDMVPLTAPDLAQPIAALAAQPALC